MLVELELRVTYTVRGTFDVPDDIAKQLEIGDVECPSDFTEWCADNINESDAVDWEYDIWDFDFVDEEEGGDHVG